MAEQHLTSNQPVEGALAGRTVTSQLLVMARGRAGVSASMRGLASLWMEVKQNPTRVMTRGT